MATSHPRRHRLVRAAVAATVAPALVAAGDHLPAPSAAAPISATTALRGLTSPDHSAAYSTLAAQAYARLQAQLTLAPDQVVWPLSQAVAATLAASTVPGWQGPPPNIREALAVLNPYWDSTAKPGGYGSIQQPPKGLGGPIYYDDNGWIGLDFVAGHRLTHDSHMLARARQLFALEKQGWDTSRAHPSPGGVFWTQAPGLTERNAVSTAVAAQLGLELYLVTGDHGYLDTAKQMFNWVNHTLRAPNGLYGDHITLTGVVDTTQWSYNQGIMLGAATLLYVATGDAAYLVQAQHIADASLQLYGANHGFLGQPAIFNAIFFKNLLLLAAVAPNPAYRQALNTYAAELGRTAPDAPRFGDPTNILDRSARAQLLAYAATPTRDLRRVWGIPASAAPIPAQVQITHAGLTS